MKTTAQLVLAALMISTAACSNAATGDDAASSDDALTLPAASASGTDMYIDWRARAELRDALGQTTDPFNFDDVVVPGVLRMQHQYSVAVVRLEPASFAVIDDAEVISEPGAGESKMGVTFPRGIITSPAVTASRAAAFKLFNALVKAKETTVSLQGGRGVEVTRASANNHFSCTQTTWSAPSPQVEIECTIGGAFQIGGVGLLWEK